MLELAQALREARLVVVEVEGDREEYDEDVAEMVTGLLSVDDVGEEMGQGDSWL